MRKCKVFLPFVLAMLISSSVFADDTTWTGTVGDKAADAKDGVVAVLSVKDGDKVKSVNLWAEGDVAKQVKELATAKATATVTGTKVDDANVKVTKIEKK